MIEKIKTFFRKHDYDTQNPREGVMIKRVGLVKFTRFTCVNCGKYLVKDLWDMANLSWNEARKCNGRFK